MIAPFSFLVPIAHAVTISMAVPGTTPNSGSSPAAFVANVYQFALAIGGVLAFGVVVYGGVKYMTSAGNPSGQGDAKEWIEAALLGLLLLVGAYFVLNVVNPQLTQLGLPPLTPVNITAPASSCTNLTCPAGFSPTANCVCQNANGTQGCGGGVQGTANSCPGGQTCVETQLSPPTYACQPTTQFDCGIPLTHYGKCANPQQGCVGGPVGSGVINYRCSS